MDTLHSFSAVLQHILQDETTDPKHQKTKENHRKTLENHWKNARKLNHNKTRTFAMTTSPSSQKQQKIQPFRIVCRSSSVLLGRWQLWQPLGQPPAVRSILLFVDGVWIGFGCFFFFLLTFLVVFHVYFGAFHGFLEDFWWFSMVFWWSLAAL